MSNKETDFDEFDPSEVSRILQGFSENILELWETIKPALDEVFQAILDYYEAMTREFFAWRLWFTGLPESFSWWLASKWPWRWFPVKWAWEFIKLPPE